MPIFEYLCKDCGHAFEKIVPRHDSSATCAHCDSLNVEKQLSLFAVAGPGKDSGSSFEGAGCGRCGAAQPGSCMLD
jgi:putative FmdB family regulatory protein